jgi:Secretion system C-terminal sorting domain
MKQLNLIIFLLSCVSLYAQDYLRPLTFDGIQPSWQQFIIDSTTLNDPKKNGFDHLTTTFLLVEESDEIAYFIHWDFSERYQGAFIQKRNVTSGAVLWTSLYNLTNSERHEFPRSAYLDEDGNLVIVNLRNNDPAFTTPVWYKASPAIRFYNKDNGQLLKYIHANEPITEDNEILFFTGLNTITIVSPNNMVNHIQLKPKPFSDTTYIIKKEYNHIGSFNRIDTSFHKRPYQYYFDNGFTVLKNKKIFNLHHSHNQNYQTVYDGNNFNQYSLVVDIYDEDLMNKKSADLTDEFPYNWKINYSGDNGQEYWLLCGDSLDADRFTEKSSKALVFVGMDGTVKEKIDFQDNKYERIYAIKETDVEGALIITQDYIQKLDSQTNEFISEIIFWKSDGNGNLTKLHTLDYRDDRTLTISSASLLGKNMVLGTYMRKYENVSDLFPKYQMKGLLGFNTDLISSISDPSQTKSIINLYPNPTSNNVNIQGIDQDVNFKIYNFHGQMINQGQSVNQQIDTHLLPSGLYIFEIQNKQVIERHKVLKIE